MKQSVVSQLRIGALSHQAHSPAFRSALELRYQVYCLEMNFLSPDDYPHGVESDEHDDDAAHFYAFNPREELVGYVRLVRPDAQQHFPLLRRCTTSLERANLPDPRKCAEISRLMVRNDYRRRRGDTLSGVTVEQNRAAFAGERRHEAPQILLSLYRQMYAYSCGNGIDFLYAAMERTLARSLQRLSFPFKPIGPETDYYGSVSPYLLDLREFEAHVGARRPDLLAWFQLPEHDLGADTNNERLEVCHLSGPAGPLREAARAHEQRVPQHA